MYKIEVHRRAAKVYQKLQPEIKRNIKDALYRLRENPFRRDLDIKALHGELKGKYRLRQGDLRIVYVVDTRARKIYIDGLSYRGSAY